MPRKAAKRRPAPVQDQLVAEALRGADGPISAYELIDRLRGKATLAPQTVYRSLGRLIADGRAHRLESINAFVACRHPSHASVAAFAICDKCGTVTEFDEAGAAELLSAWAKRQRFAVREMTLELQGRCADCGASEPK